jgi:hypothetical protein
VETYLVEHYRPGLTAAGLLDEAGRVRAASLEGVRYVRSTIVPDDEAFLSVLEAESEDAVRRAYARAGIALDRISVAIPEEVA